MNEQSVSISIKLLNRVYKIRVAPENEATVRSTANMINEKLAEFKKQFPGRDEQDYLAMGLIDLMTAAAGQKTELGDEAREMLEQLQRINNLLDQ